MGEDRKSNRGRRPLGADKKEIVKLSITLTPELYKRLSAFCEAEEREKTWAIRKALDPWLEERGF